MSKTSDGSSWNSLSTSLDVFNYPSLEDNSQFVTEDENYQTTFRTFENVSVPVDATSGYVLSEHGLKSYITIKGTAWSLKDAISNATVLEDLPSIPESLI